MLLFLKRLGINTNRTNLVSWLIFIPFIYLILSIFISSLLVRTLNKEKEKIFLKHAQKDIKNGTIIKISTNIDKETISLLPQSLKPIFSMEIKINNTTTNITIATNYFVSSWIICKIPTDNLLINPEILESYGTWETKN